MGGSVNLQGGGQYQMPGAGYSGMQGSVNAPQTADQYAAAQAARQPQQTYPRGPISFNPFTGEPDISYDGNTGTDTSNPWTGTPAPVQNPYYAYGNQTAPMMTASEATAYAPMNLPGMQLARPQFYYPSISNQMAFMGGMGGMMGGYGGGLGGMGYGGYMGMPGYFSGLGAMGSYMPMMQRSYPSYSNPYPALGGFAQYQPRDPGRARAYGSGTSTGGKGLQTSPPASNPALNPVAPPSPSTLMPVAPPEPYRQRDILSDDNDIFKRPSWADPLPPVNRTGPANAQITGTAMATPTGLVNPVSPGPQFSDEYDQPPILRNQPEPQLERSPYRPPVETDTSGLQPPQIDTLLGRGPVPDLTLPGGGVNPDFFVPGSTIPAGVQQQTAASQGPASSQGGLSSLFGGSLGQDEILRQAREMDQVNASKGVRFDNGASMLE